MREKNVSKTRTRLQWCVTRVKKKENKEERRNSEMCLRYNGAVGAVFNSRND